MKKMLIIILVIFSLGFFGCDDIGEEPQPFPGPIEMRGEIVAVVLYVNGSFYNFDYTAEDDGLQLGGWEPLLPGKDENIFTDMGSTEGGGFAGGSGLVAGTNTTANSLFSSNGTKALEFMNHVKNNVGQTWNITLFDNPPILLENFNNITFWAKYAEPPIDVFPENIPPVIIKIVASTTGGYEICNINVPILIDQRDNTWRRYSVTLDKRIPSFDGSVHLRLPPGEALKKWSIGVPNLNSGRIFIDEIVIQ